MKKNDNLRVFESQKVVKNYKKQKKLFEAEKTILNLITNKQKKLTMLDLGVGTGRTTPFFAPLFKKYIGIDYSETMVHTCKQQFLNVENTDFLVADVNNMPQLQTEGFDFIFFSFNGIDCLNNLNERIELFSNVHKLLNQEGIFAFSSHNTLAIKRLYSFQMPRRNPFKFISEIFRIKKLHESNGPLNNKQGTEFCQLYDGGANMAALISYILPTKEIALLNNAGFKRIQVIDMKGNTIPNNKTDQCFDNWIHYVCHKN